MRIEQHNVKKPIKKMLRISLKACGETFLINNVIIHNLLLKD